VCGRATATIALPLAMWVATDELSAGAAAANIQPIGDLPFATISPL